VILARGGVVAGSGVVDWAERSATALLILAAVAAATAAQGGFFARGQIAVALLLAASVVSALPLHRASLPALRLPLVAGSLLAAWGVIRAVPGGSVRTAASHAALLIGLGTVLVLCRRLDPAGRRLVLAGLLAVGVAVALVGWLAVAWRVTPWAIPSAGLWRATATLTYANAMAAVVVPLALVAVSLLASRPRSLPLALAVTMLLLGVAITLSRAGVFALLVGLIVLVAARGWSVLPAVVAPLAGAAVAFLGLLPSLPTHPPPRPGLALVALAAGLGLTALLARYVRGRAALLLAVMLAVALVLGAASFRKAGTHVWNHRANLTSPSRSNAASEALHLVEVHPLAGVGFGHVVVQRTDSTGRLRVQPYVHDEYLQILAEEGAIGAALLVALLVGLGRLLWRSRPQSTKRALWAGVVAAGVSAMVHAGFDFVWHVPAVPLILAVLVGLAITPVARIERATQGRETV
jgi:O-antigen ligase